MRVTGMTVAGYDDDSSRFAVTVTAGRASVILSYTNEDGEPALSTWQEAAETFEKVRDLVERIVEAPMSTSP